MTAATCNTHTTVTVPVAGERPEYSIRSLCMTAILEGHLNPERRESLKLECKELIERLHPESAAAKKFGKHFAWYKAQMKKDGLLK